MQWMGPETRFVHECRDMMGPGQRLKLLLLHELEDEVVRWLLGLETLLDADQEIFRALPRDLKARSDNIRRFGLIHVFTCTELYPTSIAPSCSSSGPKY